MAAVTRTSARWSSDSGAELIEFALALPLLLLLGLGILDFGLLFQHYEVVTNAAREGARVAILPGYAASDVDQRVRDYLQAGGLNRVSATVAVTPVSTTINAHCVAMTSVVVTYPQTYRLVGGVVGYFGGAGLTGGVLTATAQMRNEAPGGVCP